MEGYGKDLSELQRKLELAENTLRKNTNMETNMEEENPFLAMRKLFQKRQLEATEEATVFFGGQTVQPGGEPGDDH
jgi:hypothetical protein